MRTSTLPPAWINGFPLCLPLQGELWYQTCPHFIQIKAGPLRKVRQPKENDSTRQWSMSWLFTDNFLCFLIVIRCWMCNNTQIITLCLLPQNAWDALGVRTLDTKSLAVHTEMPPGKLIGRHGWVTALYTVNDLKVKNFSFNLGVFACKSGVGGVGNYSTF